VVDDGGADVMLRFWLESGGDGMKHLRKMKRRQWAHIAFTRSKRDTVRWRDNVGRRRGSIEEGKCRRQRHLN
jgi:hypothetical protein